MSRIKQSVCRWCYPKMSLEELARNAVGMGLAGIDLVEPAEFGILKKYNLVGTMTPSHPIEKGLNCPTNHPMCIEKITAAIEATAEAGFPNVICFSGNEPDNISREEGINHCAVAIKKIIGLVEKKKLTLCMELLNSRVDHPKYMCDRSDWGVKLVNRVGSERFKLLFDIYHVQVDEGDIIATIRREKNAIGHYHTGGVPGRNEIDETQELNYPAIMRAIAETGFSGFVAHEFIPKRDPMTSLRAAVKLCDM